jgi:hypothetical protein
MELSDLARCLSDFTVFYVLLLFFYRMLLIGYYACGGNQAT